MNKPKVSAKHKAEKWTQSVNLLNDICKIRIAPSPIHGVGIIATRDIKKGEKLYTDAIPNAFDLPYKKFKELRPEVASMILERYPNIVNGSPFLYPDSRMGAYLNHSDDPNYDAKADVTLRKIKQGEEVTEDYRQIENYQKIYKWLK
jgi:hypothetical protein